MLLEPPKPELKTPPNAPQPPRREIRAVYTDETITVYQAYCDAIAEEALRCQRLSSPFSFDRMTWIKPSFFWMMYRSGWAMKHNQERILAIDITRAGFQWCIDNSCVTTFDPSVHRMESVWRDAMDRSNVRVQWDPDRSLHLKKCEYQCIQIGIKGPALEAYASCWTVRVQDATELAREIHRLLKNGESQAAEKLAPREVKYPASAPHIGLVD